MADLYAFRALRSPRRAEPVDDHTMRTEWSEVDSFIHTHVQRYEWRATELLPQLRQLVEDTADPAAGAPPLAQAYLDGPTAVTLATLRGGVDPAATLPHRKWDEQDKSSTPFFPTSIPTALLKKGQINLGNQNFSQNWPVPVETNGALAGFGT